ncbi:MAG: type II toxin-antitoxin system RelE/ParE family toxin [Leptospirales bacterium]
MKVRIHELAALELNEAVEWYELQSVGLGLRYKKSIYAQVNKIKNNPKWFLMEEENIFKAYIPKFPYKILYSIEETTIIIWAIAHLHREPTYWQNRRIN